MLTISFKLLTFQDYVRKYTLKIRRIKKLHYGKGYDYESDPTITINFFIRCCEEHFSGEKYLGPDNIPEPERLLEETNDSLETSMRFKEYFFKNLIF